MARVLVCTQTLAAHKITMYHVHTASMPTSIPLYIPQVAYCEEAVECRRVLMLQHFAERFDPAACKGTCDNCHNNQGKRFVMQDMSSKAMQGALCSVWVGNEMALQWIQDVLLFFPKTSACQPVRHTLPSITKQVRNTPFMMTHTQWLLQCVPCVKASVCTTLWRCLKEATRCHCAKMDMLMGFHTGSAAVT